MLLRLDLNQGIYVHFLRRRELDNSPIKYTGFWHVKDFEKMCFVNAERMRANSVSSVVPAVQSTVLGVPLSYQVTATRTNLNPPPQWTEWAGRTKTTNLHHQQQESSGVEEIACSGGRVAVWREKRKVPGGPCRWPKNLRRSIKYRGYWNNN